MFTKSWVFKMLDMVCFVSVKCAYIVHFSIFFLFFLIDFRPKDSASGVELVRKKKLDGTEHELETLPNGCEDI